MVGLACFKRPLETNEINLLRPPDATPAIQSVGICQPQAFLAGAFRRSPQEGADLLSLPAVTCKMSASIRIRYSDDRISQIIEQRKALSASEW